MRQFFGDFVMLLFIFFLFLEFVFHIDYITRGICQQRQKAP